MFSTGFPSPAAGDIRVSPEFEILSPELVLVDPDLAIHARALLPDRNDTFARLMQPPRGNEESPVPASIVAPAPEETAWPRALASSTIIAAALRWRLISSRNPF
jgi:hypothetical protein